MESVVKSPINSSVEWRIDDQPVEYEAALAVMDRRVADIRAGTVGELAWLLEHPPLYTAGTSAKAGDLLAPNRFPVYLSGRGGQYTYHGPGQRIGYVMLDLRRRGPDVKAYVHHLEEWLIRTLARFNVKGERRGGRVGIWVVRGGGREDKIAAIGVRIRHWVTMHGVSLNHEPDLSHFTGIVPCGISGPAFGITSLHDLGILIAPSELDMAMKAAFAEVFGE